ncbi:hypothetical protein SAMN05216553_102509 [Lentzea fradiae]|uniref:Uncharacterized protein n=1 Tax=Lentzea fradiae TaxID=200378 RepID=A0A1G7MU16_9PSEU|nr:hypothetical protein [Lentzea fradiae]SDF65244.1 hypothetical protein SAMN05216553_102509 [Lentzea fradiae]
MTDEPGKDLAPRQPPPQPPVPHQPPLQPQPQAQAQPQAQPPAPQIDPEQLRQFQEFQRFQEYQRYQEATGQAPQAFKPHGRRWWLVVLGSRVFWRALFFLLVVFSAMWAYDNFFGRDDPGGIAQDSGGVTGPAQGLSAPAGLQGAVGMFYKHVSFADTTRACTLIYRDDARERFAQAHGASDCGEAVRKLKDQVTNVDRYQQVMFPPDMLKTPTSTRVTIDSCELTVEGGPRLGVFVVEKIGSGWVITDWSPGSCG